MLLIQLKEFVSQISIIKDTSFYKNHIIDWWFLPDIVAQAIYIFLVLLSVLNKLSQVTDEIQLVLPISMRTESALNKISLDIVCSEDEDIPEELREVKEILDGKMKGIAW